MSQQPVVDDATVGADEGLDTAKTLETTQVQDQYIKLLLKKIALLEERLSITNDDDRASQKNDGKSEAPVEKNDAEEEEEPRYVIIVNKWDPDTGDYKDDEITKSNEKKEIGPKPESRRAFTFRKSTMFRPRYNIVETVLSVAQIEAEPLQRLIGKITSKLGGDELVKSISSPFEVLVWTWAEAEDEAKKFVESETPEEKQARIDLSELMRIISTSSGILPLDQYFKERNFFVSESSISHAALWTLFPPGTLIVSHPCLGEPQIFTVDSCDSFILREEHTFDLTCFSFDWTGTEFTRVPFEMRIRHWGSNRKSIAELPFYPLKYYTSPDEQDVSSDDAIARLKERLVARGEKFVKLCNPGKGKQMFTYSGDAHFHTGRSFVGNDDDEGRRVRHDDDTTSSTDTGVGRISEARYVQKKKIDGTTMVDFTSFFEYLPPNTPILGNLPQFRGQLENLSPEKRANKIYRDMYKTHWDRHPSGKTMSSEQLMHCPPRVLGYALKQKKWAQLLVEKLNPPNDADASVFRDKLQLDPDSKELVKWSVQAHEYGKDVDAKGESKSLQDFAPDKGKGLVIMLYGHPGVGKTLTAESVALMAGKPLLSVGVSDIGIEGDKVEANLQKIFDLAGKWEAVLLFDEADVFLEARGRGENDLRRNAMVSVLLRVLEYYDGILILTTNRMRSFDIAVQSRIHIAIKYEELMQSQQIAIFESFLVQLQGKKLVHNFDDLMRWVEKDSRKLGFNGRQIRNVVSTAMGIALVDKENGGKLKREHLMRVAEQTKQFKTDLIAEEEMYKRLQKGIS
ncbi:uncharacterized protein J4E78_000008 [Alternaria triticimaculans]|uniref:uncharacterized protein n=1 Tax=Alternaria triticimaculans TaxID=297637 RepID=UPI0020C4E10E|nr:uncharacterized protein J4E78_000008 [Alternaria triticimaculans]KAI4671512.1 hypothetical protein J4E78_000008 [Alternaria triticimaculans]